MAKSNSEAAAAPLDERFHGTGRMTESIGKTRALDDLAQFAAIDGALEVGTVDSLCQVSAC
jgi:hypothetical protein